MPRQPRSNLPDGIYHVTARTTFGLQLFVDDHDRSRFLWLLNDLAAPLELRCIAYCLMDTHYHLLLEGNSVDLGLLMQRLNGRYAQRYNARHDHSGHVFGQRYSAYIIRDEAHLERAREYIAANPAKAGISEWGEELEWTWIGGVSDATKPLGQTPSGSVPER